MVKHLPHANGLLNRFIFHGRWVGAYITPPEFGPEV
jgi:hypothetical protein